MMESPTATQMAPTRSGSPVTARRGIDQCSHNTTMEKK